MNKVNEVDVKSASRLRAICQPLDSAVRAAVALGAAVLVGSAPLAAYAAAPPPPFLIDGRDGGIYEQISGASAIEDVGDGVNVVNPNFGAQSEYEAYIAALSPENRPGNRSVVSSYGAPVMIDKDERAFLTNGSSAPLTISPDGWPVKAASPGNGMVYRSPTLPDLAEGAGREVVATVGDVNLGNSAPSSAAVANEYAVGKAQGINARSYAAISSNESATAPQAEPRVIVTVGPGDYAEGYDWSVDPEQLRAATIPNLTAGAGGVPSPRSSASAYQPDVLRGPYNAPAASPVVAQPALSPEKQLQSLYENGHIPYDVMLAEIAAYAYVPPAGAQVAQSSEAAVAELQALYQNGHISRAVMEAEIASYRRGSPSGPAASMALNHAGEKPLAVRQSGPVS